MNATTTTTNNININNSTTTTTTILEGILVDRENTTTIQEEEEVVEVVEIITTPKTNVFVKGEFVCNSKIRVCVSSQDGPPDYEFDGWTFIHAGRVGFIMPKGLYIGAFIILILNCIVICGIGCLECLHSY